MRVIMGMGCFFARDAMILAFTKIIFLIGRRYCKIHGTKDIYRI